MTQPEVRDQLGDLPTDLEWVFARDGSLTALNADRSWWGGCSVPARAAEKLLKSLENTTLVSAFVSPHHAALLDAARRRTGDEPAIIALIPDLVTAKVVLATGDFAAEIAAHRLWFAVGEDWPTRLTGLLESRPGLPAPGRFIRTNLTELAADDAMISAAQAVFAAVAAARQLELEQLQNRPPRLNKKVRRLLVIRPSRFRLWNDASIELDRAAEQFTRELGGEVVPFDSDDPASSSLLALARAADNCDAVLAANLYRQDLPGIVAGDTPWFTWVTRGPVPPFDAAAAGDRLALADDAVYALAESASWPADRRHSGETAARATPITSPRRLAVVADLRAVVIPPAIDDLSSHRLLWEYIQTQVRTNPFVVGNDPQAYLLDCARRGEMDFRELDIAEFVDGLIVPTWQCAIVGLLVGANVPVDLHGAGCAQEISPAAHAAGPLKSREEFERACTSAAALLHVWPGQDHHPIYSSGRPVIAVFESWPRLLSKIKSVLNGDKIVGVPRGTRLAIPIETLIHASSRV